MMTLKIISSEALPDATHRDPNIIYFLYDKLQIYYGRNYYSDMFCIVEKMPDKPIDNILYIVISTGDVYVFKHLTDMESREVNEKLDRVAELKDKSQLHYLTDAGTTYFVRSEYRYLDPQRRALVLPYQNGVYQLLIDKGYYTKIDNSLVLRYDIKNHAFVDDGREDLHHNYVTDGNLTDPKRYGLPYIGDYKVKDTDTVHMEIDHGIIKSSIKLSKKEDNSLRIVDGGLYTNVSHNVSQTDFEILAEAYNDYKTIVDQYTKDIKSRLDNIENTIGDESLEKKIVDAMTDYKPTIDDIVDNYDTIYAELTAMRDTIKDYTDYKLDELKTQVNEYLNSIPNAWYVF